MSPDESEAIAMLRPVTYPVASYDKRFAAHLQDAARVAIIGEKSVPQLWRIFIKYRRQTSGLRKAELLKLAATLSAPDFRKVNATAREQARIDAMKAQAK